MTMTLHNRLSLRLLAATALASGSLIIYAEPAQAQVVVGAQPKEGVQTYQQGTDSFGEGGWPYNVKRSKKSWMWQISDKQEMRTLPTRQVSPALLEAEKRRMQGYAANPFPDAPAPAADIEDLTPPQLGGPKQDAPREADTTLPAVTTGDLMQSLAGENVGEAAVDVPAAAPSSLQPMAQDVRLGGQTGVATPQAPKMPSTPKPRRGLFSEGAPVMVPAPAVAVPSEPEAPLQIAPTETNPSRVLQVPAGADDSTLIEQSAAMPAIPAPAMPAPVMPQAPVAIPAPVPAPVPAAAPAPKKQKSGGFWDNIWGSDEEPKKETAPAPVPAPQPEPEPVAMPVAKPEPVAAPAPEIEPVVEPAVEPAAPSIAPMATTRSIATPESAPVAADEVPDVTELSAPPPRLLGRMSDDTHGQIQRPVSAPVAPAPSAPVKPKKKDKGFWDSIWGSDDKPAPKPAPAPVVKIDDEPPLPDAAPATPVMKNALDTPEAPAIDPAAHIDEPVTPGVPGLAPVSDVPAVPAVPAPPPAANEPETRKPDFWDRLFGDAGEATGNTSKIALADADHTVEVPVVVAAATTYDDMPAPHAAPVMEVASVQPESVQPAPVKLDNTVPQELRPSTVPMQAPQMIVADHKVVASTQVMTLPTTTEAARTNGPDYAAVPAGGVPYVDMPVGSPPVMQGANNAEKAQKVVTPAIAAPTFRVEAPAARDGRLVTPRLVEVVEEPQVATAPVVAAPAPVEEKTPQIVTPVTDNGEPVPMAQIDFSPASYTINPEGMVKLKAIAATMNAAPEARLLLNGYGYSRSDDEAMRYSMNRALAVRAKLAEFGIQPTRIEIKALGKDTPSDIDGSDNRVDAILH